MTQLFRLARRRLGDDSGHVGVLMAMVIFVVVGMLMMTWNTAQLSKEKIRLQNAADSAALGFCVWQARGMNAVQNINDEMYVSLSTAWTLLNIATFFEGIAVGLEQGSALPIAGPFLLAASQGFHIVAMLTGGCSGLLSSRICPWILRPLGYFYAYGSTALAWWGAEQFAAKNRADPLGNASLNFDSKSGNLGFYAVGIAFPFRDMALLPVEQVNDEIASWDIRREINRLPWIKDFDQTEQFKMTRFTIYSNVHKIFGTGKPWKFRPWISKRGDKIGVGVTPGPSIWIAHKYYTHIETLPLDVWAKNFSGNAARNMPMFAIAAAQCISGDVVTHSKRAGSNDSKEVNQRLAGFGTGATAKLIPIATAISALNKGAGNATNVIFYH